MRFTVRFNDTRTNEAAIRAHWAESLLNMLILLLKIHEMQIALSHTC